MATARIAFLSTSLKLKLPFLRKENNTFFFAFRLKGCHIKMCIGEGARLPPMCPGSSYVA